MRAPRVRIDSAIGTVLRPVVFAGMAALIAVITLQIVSRVFFTSVQWTEEVARFLLVWVTFLGAALAFQQNRHIAVTVLPSALPHNLRRACVVIQQLVVVAFFVVLIFYSYRYMQLQSFQRSPSLGLSMSNVYAVIPLSSFLIALIGATDLARAVRGDVSKFEQRQPEI